MADNKPPSKRQLEIQLAKLRILDTPKLKLEQYPVSPKTAAELLYMAGFEHHDLDGRVIDLGTGTGRLAIGAALMGSKSVLGVDVDPQALEIAHANARTADVDVQWLQSAIESFEGSCDTVVMNPPYGTRTSHADTMFLKTAFKLATVVYSIHKSSTRDFLTKFVGRSNRTLDAVRSMRMEIPHMFSFHTQKTRRIEVDLCRLI
ncbi:MAG TPA: METTL5 family protein [Candidatus Dormibacteraeota bacterium]|jgi:putative methylase|nr:METTL5 family protein [Candidatus Dormibacteraeota bacterium]